MKRFTKTVRLSVVKTLVGFLLCCLVAKSGVDIQSCHSESSQLRPFLQKVKAHWQLYRSSSSRGAIAEVSSYKAVLFSGDDSIDVFDNAREKISSLLQQKGLAAQNIHHLSLRFSGDAAVASTANLANTLQQKNISSTEACLVHLSSHGTKQGFVIRNKETISPESLASVVNSSCGMKPTVVLISACYSGVFLEEPALLGPNRFIMTAARKDRPSFGCGAENLYNFWDGCLIDHLEDSHTWTELSQRVKNCIEEKETTLNYQQSFPQTYIGKNMREFKIGVAKPS